MNLMSDVRLVPQRELRNHTADVLREVEAGATVRITVNGRPVADLVPVGRPRRFLNRDVLERMARIAPDPDLRRDLETARDADADDLRDRWERVAPR
jgi:prevent-host-death family protein